MESVVSRSRNLNLMKTLDDAWNAGPGSPLWETFRKRHAENVAVYWPGGAPPTRGRHNHDLEAVEFFKTFPDNDLINNPYKIFFGQGDYTCTVADFSGTMKGPMKTADGKGAMAIVGNGTIATFGVPALISPSGNARVPLIGIPSLSSEPNSNTSCVRHMAHMPAAKCG